MATSKAQQNPPGDETPTEEPTAPTEEPQAVTQPGPTADTTPEDVPDAVKEQREADLKAREENPNAPVTRESNPNIGGESFGYGAKPTA